MIPFEDVALTPETVEELATYLTDVNAFREEGPLDNVSVAKLEEHFRASHVYHSADIEGNRLTLQETMLVLREGIEISGKPAADSIEVRHLANAFDFLKTLAANDEKIRESDIRSLHQLIVGDDDADWVLESIGK